MIYGGRLAIQVTGPEGPYTISPNTIGLFINMSLVSVLSHRSPFKLFFIVIGVAGLILSNSRGALLSSFFICILFIIDRYRLTTKEVLLVITMPVLGSILLLLSADFSNVTQMLRLSDSSGSGRTLLWASLVLDLLESPFNLIFGFGPGAVDYEIYDGHNLKSAHNGYLEIVYNFGFDGFWILF